MTRVMTGVRIEADFFLRYGGKRRSWPQFPALPVPGFVAPLQD